MGSSSDLFASGGKLVIEIITASKVWTPPQALLDKGGVVTAELVGGGGGGGGGAYSSPSVVTGYGGAGAGGWRILRQTIVTAAINAVIGAGGIGGAASSVGSQNQTALGTVGQAGGTTTFNGLSAPGGGGGGGGYANSSSGTPNVMAGSGGGGGTHGAPGTQGSYYSNVPGGQYSGGYPGGYGAGGGNGNVQGSGAGAGAGGPAFSTTSASNIFQLSMPGPGVNGYGVGGPSALFGTVGWADQPNNSGNGGGGGVGNQKGWNGGSGVIVLSYVV
ncbi:glycine-rich domain-containing protein [Xylophilus sp. Leaf220]|uniref:glycine-rich domain-containing protein n=1 Tax=Xylophilus sp. Leaf220 TaxID=1735686 RepID=UPI0012E1214A|nr:hypothetical protein [Xylophilus sp. Leaf220]